MTERLSASCGECGQAVRIRTDGTVGKHPTRDVAASTCWGTGLPPAGHPDLNAARIEKEREAKDRKKLCENCSNGHDLPCLGYCPCRCKSAKLAVPATMECALCKDGLPHKTHRTREGLAAEPAATSSAPEGGAP